MLNGAGVMLIVADIAISIFARLALVASGFAFRSFPNDAVFLVTTVAAVTGVAVFIAAVTGMALFIGAYALSLRVRYVAPAPAIDR